MREKWQNNTAESAVEIKENRIEGFHRSSDVTYSFRVYRGQEAGIHYQRGEMDDEHGFAKAEANLAERARPYPFPPESGRHYRDKTERKLSDRELMDVAGECLEWLTKRYPKYIFSGGFTQGEWSEHWVNEAGMDLFDADCAVEASITFKHADSLDLCDGDFGFDMRNFDRNVFFRMADDYLGNFERRVELPEEIVIDMQYYDLLGILAGSLYSENLAMGVSPLSGKVGEKVFSEELTVTDDVSDEECWFNTYWDGEGCFYENGRLLLIDRGVIVTGYSDKRCAKKYGMPYTRSACASYGDVAMGASCRNMRISRSRKTVKELLDGRLAVIPVMMSGGGFNEKGEYAMPVQTALLYDGERVLGKLPPFTIVSNLFDLFGRDFIGVGADDPIFHDKQILFRTKAGKIS